MGEVDEWQTLLDGLAPFPVMVRKVSTTVKSLANSALDFVEGGAEGFKGLTEFGGVTLNLTAWEKLGSDLGSLTVIADDISTKVPGLATSADMLSGKMPSVKSTVDELSNLASLFNDMKVTKVNSRELKKSLKTLRQVVEDTGLRTEQLVRGIGDHDEWARYLKALQPFEAVMTGIGKSFVGIERGLAVIFSSAGAPITSAAALVERLGDPEEWNAYLQALLPFQPIMVSIATVADQVLQGTTTLLKAAIGLNTLAESDNMGLGTMESWEPFGDRLDSLADLFENQIAPSTEQLLSAIVRFSVALPKIHEQINLLDTVKIKAAMVQAGATALFQQDGTSIEVTGEDANVEFHINITMDAAQVADAMVSSGVLAGTKEQ
jgi:hypothetical protein